jgi:hypothetical protein
MTGEAGKMKDLHRSIRPCGFPFRAASARQK